MTIQDRYLQVWRETVKNYLKKGKFTKIPKKGTPEYEKLYKKYQNALLNSHPIPAKNC